MPNDIILETRNLRREFGALVAVADVSMQVKTGSFHSVIGPNGAGKTTFFNLLSGNLKPTAGQVLFKGEDITRLPVYRTIHKGIGRSFQITNIFPNLTERCWKTFVWRASHWAAITLSFSVRTTHLSSMKNAPGK